MPSSVIVKETFFGIRIDSGLGVGVRAHDDLVVALGMGRYGAPAPSQSQAGDLFVHVTELAGVMRQWARGCPTSLGPTDEDGPVPSKCWRRADPTRAIDRRRKPRGATEGTVTRRQRAPKAVRSASLRILCEGCWKPFPQARTDQRSCRDSCRKSKYQDLLRQDINYRIQQIWDVLPADARTAACQPITALIEAINKTLWTG